MYYDCGFHGYLHCFVLIVCTMIVAFLGILIILLSVACTMFVALLGIIILFLFQLYVLWLCFPKQISSLDLRRLAEITNYFKFLSRLEIRIYNCK